MKHLLTSLLFLTLLSTSAFAQVIKGTISYDNEPLAGVTVLLKGSQNGTLTDLDGKYEINVSEGQDTLEFSYFCCETLYKTFNLNKGDTIVFDTTLTENKYNKYPSSLWEMLGGIPIYGNKY
ncbi:MAG: carboxypeptidase-like regulatory domain-containing protein, partial [Bacteroidales bacterium]|nr:carboxypeptidase-like regulatory domain-containing protein [Bacteroidales bacterium]